MAVFHNCAQREEEWYRLRAGRPTASEFDRIVTPTGKASKQCTGYMNRLLAEHILGEPIFSEVDNAYMQHGRDEEDNAVKAFEFQTGLKTSKIGFVTSDDGRIGCSPDRLVEDIGVLEVKCPSAQVHVGYMIGPSVADDYRVQHQGQLLITGREKGWVISYHPKLPPVIIEIARDEQFIACMKTALETFCTVMEQCRMELEQRFGPFERAKPKPKVDDMGGLGITAEDLAWLANLAQA